LRDPVASDALLQYIKNFMLLPVVAVLLSMSAISGEFSRNIAQLVLVKPVSNTAYVMSKLVTLAIAWSLGLALSSALYLFYTFLLFDTVPDVALFLGMNLGFWALLTLFSVFTLLSGSFLASPGATAGAGIGFYVIVVLCGQSRALSSFLPSGLNGSHIATGEFPLSQFATTLLLTTLFAALAVRGVRSKRTG
jgi:ABC-type transport system involved in multi-copper enzyme maturation permease subunit